MREQARRFEAFKMDLEDKQRRLVRFENVQEVGSKQVQTHWFNASSNDISAYMQAIRAL